MTKPLPESPLPSPTMSAMSAMSAMSTKRTRFLHPLPTSTSALAARRAISRPLTPPDLHHYHQQPTTHTKFHHPTPSLTPPPTASEIPSPTTIAMREYINQHPSTATPPSPVLLPAVPRRHSVALTHPEQPHPAPRRSSVQTAHHHHHHPPPQQQQQQQPIHNPLDPRYLGNIPFSYTSEKLREWGTVYLFNAATADAFIRAIATATPAHPPSTEIKIEAIPLPLLAPPPSSSLVRKQLVTVKIVPSCKTRKPFFMQKSFPIRQSPAAAAAVVVGGGGGGGSNRISKSPRYRPKTLRKRPAVPIR